MSARAHPCQIDIHRSEKAARGLKIVLKQQNDSATWQREILPDASNLAVCNALTSHYKQIRLAHADLYREQGAPICRTPTGAHRPLVDAAAQVCMADSLKYEFSRYPLAPKPQTQPLPLWSAAAIPPAIANLIAPPPPPLPPDTRPSEEQLAFEQLAPMEVAQPVVVVATPHAPPPPPLSPATDPGEYQLTKLGDRVRALPLGECRSMPEFCDLRRHLQSRFERLSARYNANATAAAVMKHVLHPCAKLTLSADTQQHPPTCCSICGDVSTHTLLVTIPYAQDRAYRLSSKCAHEFFYMWHLFYLEPALRQKRERHLNAAMYYELLQ